MKSIRLFVILINYVTKVFGKQEEGNKEQKILIHDINSLILGQKQQKIDKLKEKINEER